MNLMKRQRILAVGLAASCSLLTLSLLPSCDGGKSTPESGGSGSAGEGITKGTKTLKFSAIPDQNSTELKEKYGPIAEYLSDTLGVPVEYVPSTDYDASVNMFKNGEIQLAWFGGLTGVQAREAVEGAHAIAMGEEDAEFVSYFIANKNSGLMPSDDFPMGIADKKFTFGSQTSTSGRLMPEHYLRVNTGKGPQEFFTTPPAYSGSHDATLEQVASGQFDCGVLNYSVYDKALAAGTITAEDVPILWKTPSYADYNFTAHPDLEKDFGAGFTDKLKQALIDMKDPKLLSAFPRKAMIEAKDEDFEGIKKVAQDLGFLR